MGLMPFSVQLETIAPISRRDRPLSLVLLREKLLVVRLITAYQRQQRQRPIRQLISV
jgi:hypothetical protein